jgi:response regulator RpfG family c-di-GMP phosphodiesterase
MILLLEDTYGEIGKKAMEDLGFEVTLVRSLEELKQVSEEELKPNIVILDVNVPEKEGEAPMDLSKESKEIVDKKFGRIPTFYYTSIEHGKRFVRSGIGTNPQETEAMLDILKNERIDSKICSLLGLDRLDEIGDKTKEENWKNIFLLMPLFAGPFLSEVFKSYSKELRKKTIEFLEKTNPELAEALKRRYEIFGLEE